MSRRTMTRDRVLLILSAHDATPTGNRGLPTLRLEELGVQEQLVRALVRRGFVEHSPVGWRLTDRGLAHARSGR